MHSRVLKMIATSDFLRPRLHDTTGCQAGCSTGLTTGCIAETEFHSSGVHQIRFWAELHPGPRWESLQLLVPLTAVLGLETIRHSSWFMRALLLRGGEAESEGKG